MYKIIILIHLIYHLNQNISNILKIKYKKINKQIKIIILKKKTTHTYINNKKQ